MGLENPGQPLVGPMDPLIDGRAGHSHHLGDGVTREVLPCVEHDDLTVFGLEFANSSDDLLVPVALNHQQRGIWSCGDTQ